MHFCNELIEFILIGARAIFFLCEVEKIIIFIKNMSIEKYNQAWEKFQNKMIELKRKRHNILKRISEKLDMQHIETLRKKMNDHV